MCFRAFGSFSTRFIALEGEGRLPISSNLVLKSRSCPGADYSTHLVWSHFFFVFGGVIDARHPLLLPHCERESNTPTLVASYVSAGPSGAATHGGG